MTDTVTAKLAEWEALTEAATEGPWVLSVRHPFDEGRRAVGVGHGEDHGAFLDADAEFIAAAREMVPALLGLVEDVREGHVREVIAVHEGHGEEAWCPVCREHWPCRVERALTKWIGGEG